MSANCRQLQDARMTENWHNHLKTLWRLLSSTTCWRHLQCARMAKTQLGHNLLTSATRCKDAWGT
eukprot:10005865-Lingulodinium_polyedra.AAC.1